MKFRETVDGIIINHTIHDHNGSIGIIKNSIRYIDFLIKKDEFSVKKIQCELERINEACDKAKEAVDYTYVKLKERHEITNSGF